jgi:hypothetical protein
VFPFDAPTQTRKLISLEIFRVTLHQQTNDQAEQSKNSSKDLNGENLDESSIVNKKHLRSYALACTYSVASAASARAALLPLMPTQTPQIKLHMPTVSPAQNNAYPVKMLEGE